MEVEHTTEELPEYLKRAEAVRAVVAEITSRLMELSDQEHDSKRKAIRANEMPKALSHAERASAFYEASRVSFDFIKRGLH